MKVKMDKKKLRERFDKVVADYVAALLKMYDWDERDGYWVADDTTGIYAYGDNHFLSLSDVMYIVDNDVQEKTLEEWEEYCLWAHEFNQTIPNLDSWVRGCPRASNEEIKALRKAKQDLDDAVNTLKKNISMETERNAYKMGKGFVCDIDVDWWTNNEGQYKACANLGEEYYESDPYKSKDLALCEIKGWLEGIRAKIDGTIKNLGV